MSHATMVVERNGGGEYSAFESCHKNMDESYCGRHMIESCHTLLHQVLSAMAEVSKAPVSIKCRLGAHARICTGAC